MVAHDRRFLCDLKNYKTENKNKCSYFLVKTKFGVIILLKYRSFEDIFVVWHFSAHVKGFICKKWDKIQILFLIKKCIEHEIEKNLVVEKKSRAS